MTLFLLARVVLDWTYVSVIASLYASTGFVLNPNPLKIFESYVLLLALAALLPVPHGWKVSDFATRLILFLVYTPFLSLFALSDMPRGFVYCCATGFVLTVCTSRLMPSLQRVRGSYRRSVTGVAYGASAAFLTYLLVRTGLPSLETLTLGSAVYETRAANDWGGLVAYLIGWQARVVNVFVLLRGWTKRSVVTILLGLAFTLLLFLVTAHKSYLFVPLLAVVFLLLLRCKRPFVLFLRIGIAIMLLSTFASILNISNMPVSLSIRRALFVPAKITYEYYDFFTANPKMYLSQSKLGGILDEENPYEDYESVAYMMGAIYGDNPENHRNTGYLGAAYMNFGWIGIPIVSILLGVILVAMDSATGNPDAREDKALFLSLLVVLANASLLTSVVTHGIGFGLLLVILARSYRRDQTAIGPSSATHSTLQTLGRHETR